MNHIEQEFEWLENEALEIQRRYPNARSLPAYLDTLSRITEDRREELRQTERFIAGIPDQRVREIACYRLLEGMTYSEIAEIMRYSCRHVQRLWRPYNGKKSTAKRCRR